MEVGLHPRPDRGVRGEPEEALRDLRRGLHATVRAPVPSSRHVGAERIAALSSLEGNPVCDVRLSGQPTQLPFLTVRDDRTKLCSPDDLRCADSVPSVDDYGSPLNPRCLVPAFGGAGWP